MITAIELRKRVTALALCVTASFSLCHPQDVVHSDGSLDSLTRIMTIGEHTFSPTSFIPDPFVRTFARNTLGFGISPSVDIPPVEIGGQQYALKSGELVFALFQFEFQTAIRQRLAFDVQMNVLARLANETIPLVSQGVVLIGGYELGVLLEVYRSEKMTLALSAGAISDGTTDVNFQRFLSAVLDTAEMSPDDALVASIPSVRAFGEFRLAYSINELLGFIVQGKFAYGEPQDRSSSNEWFNTFAAVLDVNPSRRWNAPVGFGLGFKTRTNPLGSNANGENITSVFGHISYVGARDFNLGLDLAYDMIPLRNLSEKAGFFSAVIDMRLVF